MRASSYMLAQRGRAAARTPYEDTGQGNALSSISGLRYQPPSDKVICVCSTCLLNTEKRTNHHEEQSI